MACRTLLLKLERADLIRLPKRRGPSTNELRNRHVASVAHATDPIGGALRDLRPLRVSVVGPGSHELGLLNCLLDRYHYLGHRNTVGENIRYLARDRRGRPLGCVHVRFGGVDLRRARRLDRLGAQARQRNLGLLTNNTRFLVLPWVTVPASGQPPAGPHRAAHWR